MNYLHNKLNNYEMLENALDSASCSRNDGRTTFGRQKDGEETSIFPELKAKRTEGNIFDGWSST